MKPGRELDALVAEKVMGYAVYNFDEDYVTGIDYGLRLVKPYSTDMKAAWEVVAKLQSVGWECSVYSAMARNYLWSCSFNNGGYEEESPFTNTPPHAICLAALRAMGIEIGEEK